VASTLLLCPSPFTRAVAWGALPETLRRQGHAVAVADPTGDDLPPYAIRWVAACAQTAKALDEGPVTLIAHSGAGPLLPRLGAAIQASGRAVSGYVFFDASLPRPGTRLELLANEDSAFAAALKDQLEGGGRFPEWTDEDLVDDVPDPADRAALVAALRPRGLDFFVEPLPAPGDGEPGGWPDAPCGYLLLSEAYAAMARTSRSRAWPVVEHAGHGHFAAMSDPDGTAHAIGELLKTMHHM
jgi:Alpha/beta hydrolase family